MNKYKGLAGTGVVNKKEEPAVKASSSGWWAL